VILALFTIVMVLIETEMISVVDRYTVLLTSYCYK
jgi:hypothetical protein